MDHLVSALRWMLCLGVSGMRLPLLFCDDD